MNKQKLSKLTILNVPKEVITVKYTSFAASVVWQYLKYYDK